MKFSFEHMSFKDGRNRIQFVHLKKPVKYGLAGMAQSKLFDQNLPFVVRDDLPEEGEMFACLSQGINGEAPRIEMTREIFYTTALFHYRHTPQYVRRFSVIPDVPKC